MYVNISFHTSDYCVHQEAVIRFEQPKGVKNQMQPIVIHSPHDELITLTLRTLESAHSQRVYFQTYRAWCDWCVGQGINPLHYTPAHVIDVTAQVKVRKSKRCWL